MSKYEMGCQPRAALELARDSEENRREGDRHLRAIFAAGRSGPRSYRSNGRALEDSKASLSLFKSSTVQKVQSQRSRSVFPKKIGRHHEADAKGRKGNA